MMHLTTVGMPMFKRLNDYKRLDLPVSYRLPAGLEK